MQKGFTLIELIIVMAVMAILCSITIPAYGIYKEKAEITKGKTAAMQICEGVTYSLSRCNGVYKLDNIKDAVGSLTSMAENINFELNSTELNVSYKCGGRAYIIYINTVDSTYKLFDYNHKNIFSSKL